MGTVRHQRPVANLAPPALQQAPMHPSPIGNHTDPALGLMALDHQPQLLPHRPPPAPFHRGDHLNPLVSHQASPPLAAPPTLAPASRAPTSNPHQHDRPSATWRASSAYPRAPSAPRLTRRAGAGSTRSPGRALVPPWAKRCRWPVAVKVARRRSDSHVVGPARPGFIVKRLGRASRQVPTAAVFGGRIRKAKPRGR